MYKHPLLRFVCAGVFALTVLVSLHGQPQSAPSIHSRLRPSSREALANYPSVDPLVIGTNGTPFYLKGKFEQVASSGRDANSAAILSALPRLLTLMDLTPANVDLSSDQTDSAGFRHFGFSLKMAGRPIVGASLLIHVDREGWIYMINGTIPDELNPVAAQPTVSAESARGRLFTQNVGKQIAVTGEQVVFYLMGENQRLHLAHEIKYTTAVGPIGLTRTAYFDAHSGDHINTEAPIYHAKQRSVGDFNGSVAFNYDNSTIWAPPSPSRTEGQGAVSAAAVNDGYDWLGKSYDYYYNRYSYDGPDNSGSAINGSVNALFISGGNYWGNNAFYYRYNWGSGEKGYLYFGTGPSTSTNQSTSMANALDVVGHEYTHWVSDYRAIGALGYNGETGALNEAFSDIFGAMTERFHKGYTDSNVWLIGETTGNVIRSMASPSTYSTLDYYPNYTSGTGSHTGSTIGSLAFKLLATGGTHPNQSGKPAVTIPAAGESYAENIFFHALRYNIATGAGFQTVKHATASSAETLYGETAKVQTYLAWDAVGVPYNTGSLRAINISTRAYVGTGSEVMAAGFVMSGGSGTKSMLVRAVGPTLSNFGVSGALSDPYLDMGSIGSNDNWSSSSDASAIQSAGSSVGAFALPSPSLDAAMLPSLAQGQYNAVVSGVSDATGTALVEVYDTNTSSSLRLINISTRAKVVSGNPLTAGFVVTGTTGKKLLIRAIGPTLSSFGISGVLSNPILKLYFGSAVIYTNDDWGQNWNAGSIPTVSSQVGAFSLSSGSADSVLLVDLPPGAYTATVEGVSGGQGIALVEVYEVN